ncbi:MAG TPA: protein-methionine-sulfoxide reductase heme-binding subunit MsrQ, partial [Aliiroseovarius sp.]|nr:protein-methionine-sulfoxide reductase heme-binding subunit MsrQ [Aliiroseovarius sp.]
MPVSQSINSALRRVPVWLVYLLAVVPPVWLFYQAVTGGLGVDPVKGLELGVGKWGLQVLVASLAITPLRKFTGVSLIKFRRAISLIGFFYIFLHLLVWLVLDVQIVSQIWADILKRPYITIGMSAFALMLPLAITSNNWSLRNLGLVRWRRLHKLTYLALVLGGIHYTMISKVWQPEALAYLAGILILLATRIN